MTWGIKLSYVLKYFPILKTHKSKTEAGKIKEQNKVFKNYLNICDL